MWSRLHVPGSAIAVASTAAVIASARFHAHDQDVGEPQRGGSDVTDASVAAGGLLARNRGTGGVYISNIHQIVQQWPIRAFAASSPLRCDAAVENAREQEGKEDTSETVENWSSTHKITTKAFLRPESTQEVERIVEQAHKNGTKLRVLGNAISPNGLGLSEDTMLTMALCDKVLEVDPTHMTVRVQAGASVERVTEALKPYSLTLQNFASINEQQIGGFLQVGAHGTGVTIPPVDEQIVSMRLVTPGLGPIEIGRESNPRLFGMVKVGLGAFGVVTEVTLQCVPRHRLVEDTKVLTVKEVMAQHAALLKDNRHARYMWIPFTDAVVVVTSNPPSPGSTLTRTITNLAANDVVPSCSPAAKAAGSGVGGIAEYSEAEKLEPLLDLLVLKVGRREAAEAVASGASFAELRDKLLVHDPLNKEWVVKINRAEAEFWRRSEGRREDFSDKVLAFECGGQQWVDEVAFPTGTVNEPSGADVAYMAELLRIIEEADVPAPAPIEQRWTACSGASMSPAHARHEDDVSTVYSWVGIIHYLPTDDPEMREAITKSFLRYRDLCKAKLWDKYEAAEHWAKLEKPTTHCEAKELQRHIRKRYPVDEFNALRKLLDPKNIMANDHLDAIFGTGAFDYSQPKKKGKATGNSGSGGGKAGEEGCEIKPAR